MEGGHACLSSRGYISEDYYVSHNRNRERDLIAEFGNFTTEAVWFGEFLRSVTVYSGDGLAGISGLSIETLSEIFSIGDCDAKTWDSKPKSMILDAPTEVLTEIDVRTSRRYPLAITVSLTFHSMWALAHAHAAQNQLRPAIMFPFTKASGTSI